MTGSRAASPGFRLSRIQGYRMRQDAGQNGSQPRLNEGNEMKELKFARTDKPSNLFSLFKKQGNEWVRVSRESYKLSKAIIKWRSMLQSSVEDYCLYIVKR